MIRRAERNAQKTTLLRLGQFFLLVLALSLPIQAFAQTDSDLLAERKRAFELYDQNKFVDAIPALEKLALVLPSDMVLLERLGWSMFVVSGSTKDPEVRKQLRTRALEYLNRSKELGNDSNLLETGLSALSQPDPVPGALSPVAAADAALREGEEAHARGDLDDAIKGYKRALELDPKLYLAALFTGDMYFKKGHNTKDTAEKKRLMAEAGEWFARAIAINEEVETAYRYWGDALMAIGDNEGAKAKFIDAIIAEPFNRTPYVGLMQWADALKIRMGHPNIQQPKSSMTSSENKTIITIDPKAMTEHSPAYYWSFYDLTRAAYKAGRFQKEYPGEKDYRHSLKEEAAALRMVAGAVLKDLESGTIKAVDPALEVLVKLYKAELIEPYVLFVLRDEGIAHDYVAYRKTNREKLRLYWVDFVIPKQSTF
jgi:tetratricopeptide (TPR) repeat protein